MQWDSEMFSKLLNYEVKAGISNFKKDMFFIFSMFIRPNCINMPICEVIFQ